MKKLDFGSGYNPESEYETCDIYGYVDYYFDPIEYKTNIEDKSFDIIRCRNVIHHIQDLDKLSKEFSRILKGGGILEITEPKREFYTSNYYLDYLWYRFIIPRYEVWFSKKYRNCKDYFKEFDLGYYDTLDEKEMFIFIKKMDTV